MFSEDEHRVFKSGRIFYERYELGIKTTQRSPQQTKKITVQTTGTPTHLGVKLGSQEYLSSHTSYMAPTVTS